MDTYDDTYYAAGSRVLVVNRRAAWPGSIEGSQDYGFGTVYRVVLDSTGPPGALAVEVTAAWLRPALEETRHA